MASYEQRVMWWMSAATLACVLLAGLISAWFGWQTGQQSVFATVRGISIHWGWLYAAANLLFDGMQIGFSIFIAMALFSKRCDWRGLVLRAVVIVGGAYFWVMLTGLSWTSIMGANAMNRADGSSERQFAIEEKDRLQGQIKSLQDARPSWTTETIVYKGTPAEALDEQLRSATYDRAWKSTNECALAGATNEIERAFCKRVAALKAAKEIALQTAENTKQISALTERISKLGATKDTDPQARILAGLMGTDERGGRDAWAKGWAYILESIKLAPALFYFAVLLFRPAEVVLPLRKPRAAKNELAPLPAQAVADAVKAEKATRRAQPKKRLGQSAKSIEADAQNVVRLGFDVRSAVKDAIGANGRLYVTDAAPILGDKFGIDPENKTVIGRMLRPLGTKKRDNARGGATYYQVA